jgi:hypothetical protein
MRCYVVEQTFVLVSNSQNISLAYYSNYNLNRSYEHPVAPVYVFYKNSP